MNKNNNAFTIIELLVAIVVVIIITLSGSNIAFRAISDKQNLEISTNKIISEIERIRNNSLIWKWIWTNLIVPKTWKIDFSSSWSWVIKTNYTNDWTNWILNNNIPVNKFEINKVICINVDGTNTQELLDSQTWSIIFEWWKYKLWWDCPNLYSRIKIETKNKSVFKYLEFDVINWLIKR